MSQVCNVSQFQIPQTLSHHECSKYTKIEQNNNTCTILTTIPQISPLVYLLSPENKSIYIMLYLFILFLGLPHSSWGSGRSGCGRSSSWMAVGGGPNRKGFHMDSWISYGFHMFS